jgi:hypothetical protein
MGFRGVRVAGGAVLIDIDDASEHQAAMARRHDAASANSSEPRR